MPDILDFINHETSLKTPMQTEIDICRAPCVFYGFNIMQNTKIITDAFEYHDPEEYSKLIEIYITDACVKKVNYGINDEHMFINDPILCIDYNDIVQKCKYKEIILMCGDTNLKKILLNVKEYALITREQEAFPIIRNINGEFLICDSHRGRHGFITLENLIRYVGLDGEYVGSVEILYC